MHPQLPVDIVHQILERLPIKYLAQFRCVSKLWKEIINSPYLARKQLHLIREDPKLLCIVYAGNNDVSDLFTSRISKKTIEIIIPYNCYFQCACNGVHCFTLCGDIDAPAVLYNPLRQETLKLPSAIGYLGSTKIYGLGFDAKNNLFKAICFTNIFDEDDPDKYFCIPELHIVGQQSWKRIELPDPLQGVALYGTVFLNGAIHCIIQRPPNHEIDGGDFDVIIVAFDIEKEQFRLIDSPPCLLALHLMESGGLLAHPEYSFDSIKIWVLKDYSKGEWIVKCIIQNFELTRFLEISTHFRFGVVEARENEVLLFGGFERFVSYDIKTGRKSELILSPRLTSDSWIHYAYSHQLSLVPLI